MNETKNYVDILENTLKMKVEVLKKLNKIEFEKDMVDEDSMDSIDKYLDEKEELIKNLETLDEGFETTYEYAKDEINNNKDLYKEKIISMQNYIKEITDITVQLRIKEANMKESFDLFCKGKKDQVKKFNKGTKTALSYYKNMTDVHKDEDSYFFNSKG